MKQLFSRMILGRPEAHAPDDEHYFVTQFLEREEERTHLPQASSAWALRAREIQAKPKSSQEGLVALQRVWGSDHFFAALSFAERMQLAQTLSFVSVAGGRELIKQDEVSDHAIIVLEGVVAVDRLQPSGKRVRLAESRDGDILGETALGGSGLRFASCVTLSTCTLAIITNAALDELAVVAPRLGMALMASTTRQLSLRARQISARLAAMLTTP
jgi:CRP/FNR family transcriptional regulator, cyclic AMP receptor protein